MASGPRLQRRTWRAAVARGAVLIVGFVCMVAFAVVLARATLVPSPASVRLTHTNLHPGDSIRAYLAQPHWRDAVKQVGGNVLLGLPFGVLLPVLFPRTRGLVRVVLMTAFVMLTVEAAQGLLVTGRAFDIDDVILNSLGSFAGYLLLGRRLGRALHPRRHHWWQRRPADSEASADSPPDPGGPKPRLPAILRAVRKPAR
ncbi:VanZ family protein [Streptomyces violascens]|uniref:VanZ family protein n=1 Tax=Streptomyces violascens TaxID=67381 RepID=UPI003650F69F